MAVLDLVAARGLSVSRVRVGELDVHLAGVAHEQQDVEVTADELARRARREYELVQYAASEGPDP